MGIVLPDETPELVDGNNYSVHWDAYLGGCSGIFVTPVVTIHTGAEINAWYDAGNQCVAGFPIFFFPGIDSTYITEIVLIA